MRSPQRTPIRRGSPRRSTREREILDAARQVFAEQGYAHASVAEIGKRVGVVEGTVYTYFPTKRDLLLRVVADFYEDLIRDVESGLRAIRGAENRLRFLIARHLQLFVRDLGICRVILSEVRPDPNLYGGAVRKLNQRYTALALEVIEEGIRAGELRSDIAPTVLRDLIYGGIEHALWRCVHGGKRVDIEAVGEQLGNALLHGILRSEDATAERLERALSALERRAGALS